MRKVMLTPGAYFPPTFECSRGLSGWWNPGKFGKKELTEAEKAEKLVMEKVNNCVYPIAHSGRFRTFDENSKKFHPGLLVSYGICVHKIFETLFEEEEKLKGPVEFYPNFPTHKHTVAEYNRKKTENKEVVLKSLSDLTEFCTKTADKNEDKCEAAKIYNRCLEKVTEAALFWKKIDASISVLQNGRNVEEICKEAPASSQVVEENSEN
jgi:hypothetical protein